jgi:hypothetical protein
MKIKTLKTNFSFLLILCLLFSCGKDLDEKVEDAIHQANQLLSSSKCQEAIDVLEAVGRQTSNKSYLITLASGYACRGKFSELTLFTTDIVKVGTPSILGGFTTFSGSPDMTSTTDSDFLDVNLAIEILAYAGGIAPGATGDNPTSAKRQSVFGVTASGDIDAMILYLTMANIGRWLRLYGAPDGTGNKTQCVLNYNGAYTLDAGPAATLDVSLSLLPAPCQNSTTAGSGDIGAAGAYVTSNICDGIVLINTFFDVLPNVLDNYSGGELSTVNAVRTSLETAAGLLTAAKTGSEDILAATNHAKCVADNADEEFMQWFFVFMVEPLYTKEN